MTKEEFVEKWGANMGNGFTDNECISDLTSVIRNELIRFCHAKIPAEWIGDEVIIVDEYINDNQQNNNKSLNCPSCESDNCSIIHIPINRCHDCGVEWHNE